MTTPIEEVSGKLVSIRSRINGATDHIHNTADSLFGCIDIPGGGEYPQMTGSLGELIYQTDLLLDAVARLEGSIDRIECLRSPDKPAPGLTGVKQAINPVVAHMVGGRR